MAAAFSSRATGVVASANMDRGECVEDVKRTCRFVGIAGHCRATFLASTQPLHLALLVVVWLCRSARRETIGLRPIPAPFAASPGSCFPTAGRQSGIDRIMNSWNSGTVNAVSPT